MKKKLLLLSLFFVAFVMKAQYTIVDHDGAEITDGMIVEYNNYSYPDASLEFYVTNNGPDAINMRIEFVEATNADGTGFELCFGQCYIDLVLGQTVPPSPGFETIAAGATTGEGNHFYNGYGGSGSEIIDYVFRFYETDASGVDIGNSLTFTYRYNPLLGTEDVNNLDVSISSTLISNEMTVDAVEDLEMKMYDLQGRLVKSQKLSAGRQAVNTSDLSPQMYIVQFNNNEGASKTIKVIVK